MDHHKALSFGFAALLSCAVIPASACSLDRVSVEDLKTSVDDSDPNDATVYMTGTINNMCPNTVTVTVNLTSQKEDGTPIATHAFVVDSVPAGGQAFDLTGAIPYDEGVRAYSIASLQVKDTSVGMPVRRRPLGQTVAAPQQVSPQQPGVAYQQQTGQVQSQQTQQQQIVPVQATTQQTPGQGTPQQAAAQTTQSATSSFQQAFPSQ